MKLFVLVLLVASLWSVCHAKRDKRSLEGVSKSNRVFTTRLYSAIAQASKGPATSFLFSPLSLQVILAMCYMGTGGKTASELADALHLPNNKAFAKSGFQDLLREALPSSGDVTLEVANALYAAEKFPVVSTFKKMAREVFLSDIENVRFSDTSTATKTINEWVKKKTHGKIEKILDKVSPATLMMLVNVVYFKGKWLYAFNKLATRKSTFYVQGVHEKEVDMMRVGGSFNIASHKDLGAIAVELPYEGNATSLVIVLPFERNGLAAVEAKLAKVELTKVLGSMKMMAMFLNVPKFSLEHTFDMTAPLSSLGITSLFSTAKGNFSLMTPATGARVESVTHRAMIEVTEEGTVAAGASGAILAGRGMGQQTLTINVNYPFVFALVSRRAGVVLFAGRYTGATVGGVRSASGRFRSAPGGGRGASWLVAGCWPLVVPLALLGTFSARSHPVV